MNLRTVHAVLILLSAILAVLLTLPVLTHHDGYWIH